MNKLLVDGSIKKLEEGTSEVEVKGNSVLYLIHHKEVNLKIYLEESATLTVYDFCLNGENKKIEIYQKGHSKVSYIHSFKANKDYHFSYLVNLEGMENVNNIYIRGVSKSEAFLDVEGNVLEGTKNNELNEDIKILTVGGSATVSPILNVGALETLANHTTAISNIREDELFYFLSKGIDELEAMKLIENSYLYGLFKNTEFFNMIK